MPGTALPIFNAAMSRRQRWTMFVSSTSGALETFDIVAYAFFAQQIGRAFFPASAGATEMLSFALLALGYLVRPLGGLIFGHLGDKHGRRQVFAWSAMVAAAATLAIGLLPSYRVWGIAAPVLLLVLRLVQGFCVGGELPGAVVYAVETQWKNRGFLCGIVFFAVNVALLIAAALNLALRMMLNSAQMDAFGWRVGFLFGGAVGLFSFALRRTLPETDEYREATGARHRQPLAVLLRRHWPAVVTGIVASALVGVTNGIFFAYVPAWLRQFGYEPQRIAQGQMLFVVVISIGMLAVARIGDVLPRRVIFRTGAVLSALFAPCFYVLLSRHLLGLPALFFLAGIVTSFAHGTFACVIAEMFPIGVRFCGVAAAINLGLATSMGTAPLLASVLVIKTQILPAPALLIVLSAVLAFMASFFTGREFVRMA
ncbi:MFS transporter [Paraburkholderia aromaticivorans]|uniref:MFS transporter n=1 Tax=Paraburkholderia aromaticivorans TaxID=2026199 RepID=UPI0014560BE0|nr:MFS transporter [Paraburkholderia aromaticivorans]